MKIYLSALIIGATLLYSNTAQAGPFTDMMAKVDTNKDQTISFTELKASVSPFFDKADRNKDGFIDKAEHAQAIKKLKKKEQARRGREFKRQDKNKDGKVSRKEMFKHLYTFFQFMDSSKDGRLTLNELRVQSVKVMFDSRFN